MAPMRRNRRRLAGNGRRLGGGNGAGSARLAQLVLVAALRGAAHILVWADGPPATRACLPASVQLVALHVGAGEQKMLLRQLGVAGRLDAGQWQVNRFRRVVATWGGIVSHG